MKHSDKKIFLIQLSSKLTASNARMLFESWLPICKEKVLEEGGMWEQKSVKKSTYIMCLCTFEILKEIEKQIRFVVKSIDITDKLAGDEAYIFKPKVIGEFNYLKFKKAYNEQFQ